MAVITLSLKLLTMFKLLSESSLMTFWKTPNAAIKWKLRKKSNDNTERPVSKALNNFAHTLWPWRSVNRATLASVSQASSPEQFSREKTWCIYGISTQNLVLHGRTTIKERPVVMAWFCSLDQHIPGIYNLVMRPHIPVRGHLNVLDVKGG